MVGNCELDSRTNERGGINYLVSQRSIAHIKAPSSGNLAEIPIRTRIICSSLHQLGHEAPSLAPRPSPGSK